MLLLHSKNFKTIFFFEGVQQYSENIPKYIIVHLNLGNGTQLLVNEHTEINAF